MHAVQIYQILNHYTPREELDPGFMVLDNSANERPDWFEYWPIRRFLRNEALDENTFYGFLSPKFKLKTSLGSAAVREFILAAGPAVDVVLLSPSIHNSAYYLECLRARRCGTPGTEECRQGVVRAARAEQRLGFAGVGFQEHGAFELFHRQAALLEVVARHHRKNVRDCGNPG